MEMVYREVNNAVYQAGFAGEQREYERAYDTLFDRLDWLSDRLSRQRYLVGDAITEADVRLFTTLVRFDAVYHGHFKCNRHKLTELPVLWAYARDLFQTPGFGDTVDFDHIKRHYYVVHSDINPTQVVPKGPDLTGWASAHDRESLGGRALRRRHPARAGPRRRAGPCRPQPCPRLSRRPPSQEPYAGPVPSPDEIASASAAAMLAEDRASAAVGIELVSVAPGRATMTMTVRHDMVNGHDIAHGGYVFLLADSTFAVACNSYGQRTVAAGCDIAFLQPVRVGERLTAEATERAPGAAQRSLRRRGPPRRRQRGRRAARPQPDRRGHPGRPGRGPAVSEAFLVDGVRTPIGRYGGALAAVRPDDLAAHALRALTARLPQVDWSAVDDVVLGCANQAGEDNRNVARMALLLAGLPETVPGSTVNRLCGSGADAVAIAARAVRAGEADLVVAGGVESMSRAPFVMAKAQSAYDRTVTVHDTTLGWRFVNPLMERLYGTDSMGETAENVAEEHGISRDDQDAFALRSQERTARAQKDGRLAPGDRGRRGAAAPRRPGRGRHRRAPAHDDRRRARRAEAGLPRRRLGHGGQLVRRQRRGGGAAGGVRDRGRAVRPRAAVPGHRRRRSGRGAAGDGPRPAARDDAGCSTGPACGPPRSTWSSSTRRSPPRCSRCCAGWACPTTPST